MVSPEDWKHADCIASVIFVSHEHDQQALRLDFAELKYKYVLFELVQVDQLRLGYQSARLRAQL